MKAIPGAELDVGRKIISGTETVALTNTTKRPLQELYFFLYPNRFLEKSPQLVELSAYFKWFDADFLRWLRQKKGLRDPNVLDYVKIYLSQDKQDLLARTQKWDIDFLDYDWTLNEVHSEQ